MRFFQIFNLFCGGIGVAYGLPAGVRARDTSSTISGGPTFPNNPDVDPSTLVAVPMVDAAVTKFDNGTVTVDIGNGKTASSQAPNGNGTSSQAVRSSDGTDWTPVYFTGGALGLIAIGVGTIYFVLRVPPGQAAKEAAKQAEFLAWRKQWAKGNAEKKYGTDTKLVKERKAALKAKAESNAGSVRTAEEVQANSQATTVVGQEQSLSSGNQDHLQALREQEANDATQVADLQREIDGQSQLDFHQPLLNLEDDSDIAPPANADAAARWGKSTDPTLFSQPSDSEFQLPQGEFTLETPLSDLARVEQEVGEDMEVVGADATKLVVDALGNALKQS